jgi:hypothetical protein
MPQITAAIVEPGDDAAALCPDDARFFAAVPSLSLHAPSSGADPISSALWQLIERTGIPAAFSRDPAARDRLFQGPVAIIERKLAGRFGLVILIRTPSAPAALAPFKPIPLSEPPLGPFRLVHLGDRKQITAAVGKRWIALAPSSHHLHLRHTLTAVAHRRIDSSAGTGSLANQTTFANLRIDLRPAHQPELFVRDWRNHQRHALALVTTGSQTVVHYRAYSRDLPRLMDSTHHTQGIDFGPLPADVVSAATLNSLMPVMTTTGRRVANLLALPRDFTTDIQPRLASPMLAFVSRLPAGSDSTKVRPTVVGLAVRLRDPSAGPMLDGMIASAYRLVQLSAGDLVRTVLPGIRTRRHAGFTYRVADFGQSLSGQVTDPFWSKLLDLPQGAGLQRLSYGRVGDWWIVCSQEAFMRQCIEAQRDPQQRIAGSARLAAHAMETRSDLLLSAVMDGEAFGQMVDQASAYWQRMTQASARQPTSKSAAPPRPQEPATPPAIRHDPAMDQPLKWLAEAYGTRQNFKLQVWRENPVVVAGRMELLNTPGQQASSH